MPSKIFLAPDYVVVGLYMLAVLGAGFWFARITKSGRDFFVGGNRIPWWAAGISLYMTTFSAWMFTGAASFVYNTGWFGILWLACKPVAFGVGFLLSAVKWRRARITSPIEYVEERYNHGTRLLLSVAFVVSMMYWPGHHLAAVARISAPALFPGTPWAVDGLLLFFGLFVLVYTVAGGIWAVSITDALQFLVLFSVCVVLLLAVFASGEMGSPSTFLAEVPSLEFEHTIRGNVHYTEWYLIGFFLSGIIGFVVGDKAQRFFTVQDERAVRKTAWLAFALFLTSPFLFGLPPLVGRVLWPEMSQLASFAGSSKPDESVFIAVVMHYLPAGVVGLFLAAMMAASMSALDSVWNTLSAVVSVDLYKGHLRPRASDREILWVGRATVIMLALVAVTMALVIVHSPFGIFTFSSIVLGLIGIPVTVPLLAGIVSRTPLTWSAVPSILSGIAIAAVTRFELGWTLGPQYIAVILFGLVPLFSSRWLGGLYLRRASVAVGATVGIGLVLWSCFFLIEAPIMPMGVAVQGTDAIWLMLSLVGITLVNILFLPLYARELRRPPERVSRFFARLERPVDVASEVGSDTRAGRPDAIIGWAAAGLAIVPLVLLITSGGEDWVILLSLTAILLGIAAPFLLTSYRPHSSASAKSRR
jgi:Na+/proline symporter